MSLHKAKAKVVVVGLGYIGLPTAAILASVGHQVVGMDINQQVIEVINRGEVHIVEPDLDELVRRAVTSGHLRAELIVEPADVYIVAVPTPFKDAFRPDLSYIECAARSIAPHLRPGSLVILESTSPVGATEQLAHWFSAERPDLVFPDSQNSEGIDISIAYCPERVLPGSIVSELVANDRVVGGLTPGCAARAREFYETFVRGKCIETDARTAELTKLTENSFRDVNIAFANELSLICDELNIDVWKLIELANRHPRVSILKPGPGVGGHCIAVDPWFIVDSAPNSSHLIRAARHVNNSKPNWVIKKISEAIDCEKKRNGRDVVVACLGLAFKADIDDLRESPSLEIVEKLAAMQLGVRLLVVEPYIEDLPRALALHQEVEITDLASALIEADIVVLLVDHSQFRSIERENVAGKVIIDTRGIWR